MSKYVYVGAFEDTDFKEEDLKVPVICFLHEFIDADDEDDAYDKGHKQMADKIKTDPKYEFYKESDLMNDYVILLPN